MKSAVYFVIYTAVTVLSSIYYSDSFFAFFIPLLFAFALYFSKVPLGYKFSRGGRSTGARTIDIYYRLMLIPLPLIVILSIFTSNEIDHVLMWIIYAVTVTINYLIPALIYLKNRFMIYRELKPACGLLNILFSGRRKMYKFTVNFYGETKTVGLLGGVGAMKYTIKNHSLISQRVNPLLREEITEIEEESEENPLFIPTKMLLCGKKVYNDLEADGVSFLLIQPNAFIEYDGRVIEEGETVFGMRVHDIKTGIKYVK